MRILELLAFLQELFTSQLRALLAALPPALDAFREAMMETVEFCLHAFTGTSSEEENKEITKSPSFPDKKICGKPTAIHPSCAQQAAVMRNSGGDGGDGDEQLAAHVEASTTTHVVASQAAVAMPSTTVHMSFLDAVMSIQVEQTATSNSASNTSAAVVAGPPTEESVRASHANLETVNALFMRAHHVIDLPSEEIREAEITAIEQEIQAILDTAHGAAIQHGDTHVPAIGAADDEDQEDQEDEEKEDVARGDGESDSDDDACASEDDSVATTASSVDNRDKENGDDDDSPPPLVESDWDEDFFLRVPGTAYEAIPVWETNWMDNPFMALRADDSDTTSDATSMRDVQSSPMTTSDHGAPLSSATESIAPDVLVDFHEEDAESISSAGLQHESSLVLVAADIAIDVTDDRSMEEMAFVEAIDETMDDPLAIDGDEPLYAEEDSDAPSNDDATEEEEEQDDAVDAVVPQVLYQLEGIVAEEDDGHENEEFDDTVADIDADVAAIAMEETEEQPPLVLAPPDETVNEEVNSATTLCGAPLLHGLMHEVDRNDVEDILHQHPQPPSPPASSVSSASTATSMGTNPSNVSSNSSQPTGLSYRQLTEEFANQENVDETSFVRIALKRLQEDREKLRRCRRRELANDDAEQSPPTSAYDDDEDEEAHRVRLQKINELRNRTTNFEVRIGQPLLLPRYTPPQPKTTVNKNTDHHSRASSSSTLSLEEETEAHVPIY